METNPQAVGDAARPAIQALIRRIVSADGLEASTYRDASGWLCALHGQGERPSPRPPASQELEIREFCNSLANKRHTDAPSLSLPCLKGVSDASLKKFIYLQISPDALTRGACLQGFSNAANSHELVRALAHRVHNWYAGVGTSSGTHSAQFRRICAVEGIHLPALDSELLYQESTIATNAWSIAAYRLALSLYPDGCCDETLGAALYAMDNPFPSLLAAYARVNPDALLVPFFAALTQQTSLIRSHLLSAIEARERDSQSQDCGDTAAFRNALLSGYAKHSELNELAANSAIDALKQGYLSPTHSMVSMISKKAEYAADYHIKIKINGRPFSEYIKSNPGDFVRALGQSNWVAPGQADASRLICLLEFGSSMFRVFSDDEIDVIRRWINSLPSGKAGASCAHLTSETGVTSKTEPLPGPACQPPSSIELTATPSAPLKLPTKTLSCRISARDLYHRLLNVEHYPEVIGEALPFLEAWLARSQRDSRRATTKIPFIDYSHSRLREWFHSRGVYQALEYRESGRNGGAKDRDTVVAEAVFISPMIFIDGAWIQKWTATGLVETTIGSSLYKIFSDEIGNGDVRMNHSRIYRELVEQMGVRLPDHRSKEFAASSILDDAAFEVPAFWLAISHYPRRFLPETLGLNLAMELSGVGGAYRQAHDDLKAHGFSTLFVDLHNTIDNTSTGHSAIALEAIVLYMDDVLCDGGRELASRHWRRVWTGYKSLSPPTWRLRDFFMSLKYAYQ